MDPILPVIGSSGFYEFLKPYDLDAVDGIEYTCMAVRRISDYLANNEDVEKEVYETKGIQDVWQEDLDEDAYIVSLQSKTGHWLYVPYRYILKYPSVNGVPYRTMMIGVALPAMEADYDYSAIEADMKDMAIHHLGLEEVVVQAVETSRVVMIPIEKHELLLQERFARKVKDVTNAARIKSLEKENEILRNKLLTLEKYVIDQNP